MTVKLSVVVPVYNAAATIAAQLGALACQEWSQPWEVIIADNRCTDNSIAIVEQYRPRLSNLRVIQAYARQGQPHALNVGAQAAAGEALAFCDADDEIAPGWVAAMGEALAQYDLVGCRFEVAKLNPPWVQASRGNPQRDDVQSFRYPRYLPHAGGGGLGLKRALFESVGGFDESLPLLHDTDLCWKAQLAGAQLHFVPNAVLHVRFRDDLSGIYRQAFGYARYNVRLYRRYRAHGMPRISWKMSASAWLRLMGELLSVRTQAEWGRWVWRFAWRLGRIQGSLEQHVWAV